ncbi:hypothetical protein V8G54_010580 [Vigna mungo]|uniref:Uncharacterized protein n=1 Tax=Vigna mungo TaxID=3915 RepID=A0AAQ3S5X1_VIGMU
MDLAFRIDSLQKHAKVGMQILSDGFKQDANNQSHYNSTFKLKMTKKKPMLEPIAGCHKLNLPNILYQPYLNFSYKPPNYYQLTNLNEYHPRFRPSSKQEIIYTT